MKKTFLIVISLICLAFVSYAQQAAFVNTKYILSKMPDYQEAKKQLDQAAAQWQKEIDDKQAILDKMHKEFDAEQDMLSDDLKKKRQDDLLNREREVRDLQRTHFGLEGDWFKKKQELIKPLQDKVYSVIQKIAANKNYSMVLDKSEGVTVMFSDSKLDISEDVITALGVK